MRKSAYLSDTAFAFTALFLPLLCFLRFKGVPLFPSILLAVAFAGVGSTAVGMLLRKKFKRQTLKAREKKEAERLLLHLALMTQKMQAEFFATRLKAFFEHDEGCVKLMEYNHAWLIELPEKALYCKFSTEPLASDALLPILSLTTKKDKLVFCNELSANAGALAAKLQLSILDGNECYLRLKNAKLLPSEDEYTPLEYKKKVAWRICIQKRNARPFFTGGALTLVSSLFSPFPYYYLASGTAMIATSILLRFFGK